MRLLSRLGALAAATAIALAMAPSVAGARSALDLGALDAFLDGQLTRHGIPGLAVGLVEGDRTVHVRGFGSAGSPDRPVGEHTPFVLASVSKPLTATAVLQLVDARKVALDAPVSRYLPQLRLADPQAPSRITVRQLLDHTSGLPVSACEREVPTLDDFVRSLATVELDRPVGSRHVYCSGNYNILGAMVEQVAGQPFGQYVQQHVFDPLEMRHSYTAEAPARADGLAQGHRWIFGFSRPLGYYNPSGVPAGYLVSTAEDMTHFLLAQLDGGVYHGRRLLSADAVRQMQQPGVDAGNGTRYGLGWEQGQVGGVPMIYHPGGNYDMETIAMIHPRTHRAAVLLANTQGLLGTGAFRSIEGGVARLLDDQPAGSPVLPVPTLYAAVDAVLVVLTALVLVPLVRLVGAVARRTPSGRPARHLPRTMVRAVAELAGGLLLLGATAFIATQLGATWKELALLVPDLLPWVWCVSAALVATALLRVVVAAGSAARSRGGLS